MFTIGLTRGGEGEGHMTRGDKPQMKMSDSELKIDSVMWPYNLGLHKCCKKFLMQTDQKADFWDTQFM